MLKVSTLVFGAIVFLCGCQKSISEKDFEGKWKGSVTMSDADVEKMVKASPNGAKDLAKNTKDAKEFLKTISIDLDLKTDKTYSMSQGNGVVEGTWTYSALKLTLTPLKAAGKTKEEIIKQFPQAKAQFEPLILDTDKEGKGLTGRAPANQPDIPQPQITFARVAGSSAKSG